MNEIISSPKTLSSYLWDITLAKGLGLAARRLAKDF